MNFYECCDLTKKISSLYPILLFSFLDRNKQYICPSSGKKFWGLDNLREECKACWNHQEPVDGCSADAVYMKTAMNKWLRVSNNNTKFNKLRFPPPLWNWSQETH